MRTRRRARCSTAGGWAGSRWPTARAAEAVGGAAEGDVRRALAAVSGELEAMLAKGQGGRFGGSATPSEMRTFNANVAVNHDPRDHLDEERIREFGVAADF